MPATLPGVTLNDGVELNPALSFFLQRLRATAPASVPIHVNSGYRSPAAQARAMLTKVQLGDNLRALYGAKVERLLSLPLDPAVWTQALQAMAAVGIYMSPHMRGDALDIRTRDLSQDQIAALVAAAHQLGARPLLESTPPHLHIDGISKGTAKWVETAAARNGLRTAAPGAAPVAPVHSGPVSGGLALPALLLAIGAVAILGPAALLPTAKARIFFFL